MAYFCDEVYKQMTANRNTIIRLSKYKNALYRLQSLGFVKVFSDNLGDAIGVTPSQVRKDFSLFGISGSKRGGYQIDQLLEKLNALLGKNQIEKVVLAGAGNMGAALLQYQGFEKEGMKIVAGFDIDVTKHNREAMIPILPLSEMNDYIKTNNIKIGIIAVPDIAAQIVMNAMVSSGIRGILNFAPLQLKAPENVIINHINIAMELENVIYHVNVANKTEGVKRH
jgi:redox-sensing transcriptional repressor